MSENYRTIVGSIYRVIGIALFVAAPLLWVLAFSTGAGGIVPGIAAFAGGMAATWMAHVVEYLSEIAENTRKVETSEEPRRNAPPAPAATKKNEPEVYRLE